MAFVRVEQRNAHLAGPVRIDFVDGREGKVAKGTVTAISNVKKAVAEGRAEEVTAIQWTLWGKLAENAAEYLGRGSHVNIVGRLRNNNYEKDGETVYAMTFTVEEIDYLDSKAESDARRGQQGGPSESVPPATSAKGAGRSRPPAIKATGGTSGEPDSDVHF
jgi:single-strand DNA-binding protein